MHNKRNKNGSFLILFKDESREKVFLVFRTDYPIWVLSGGGIEANEVPKLTALRETWEETGFRVKLVRKVGEYTYHSRTTYLFEGRYISGIYRPEFIGNIGRWFSIRKLPLNINGLTKLMITDAISSSGDPFIKTINNYTLLGPNILFALRHPKAFLKYIRK